MESGFYTPSSPDDMPKPRKAHKKTYRNIHECMEDLLSREDLKRINQLGLWSAFAQMERVKQFATLSRRTRREFFDRYEKSMSDDRGQPASDTDHHLFSLPPHATTEEIHQRYRELALAFHPDRPEGDHQLMQEINAAYQRLLAQSRSGAEGGSVS